MELISGGITLRPWIFADASQLAVIADNKKIADNLRDSFPHPYSLKDAREWLSIIMPENHPPRFFAITRDKKILGSIAIATKSDIYRKSCEIGYFLAEECWGKGIATRAVKAVTSYAFRNFDFVRVYAEPFADNAGSRRVLEKAGFRLEATLRRNVIKNDIIRDSCIYSVLREEWEG